MNTENDEVAAFYQHIQSVDTLKLSALCSFQEGFEESFYNSSLDEQKRIARTFLSSEYIDLAKSIESLTIENAKSFFSIFFESAIFRQNFGNYFETRYEKNRQKGLKIARMQTAKQFIDAGIDISTIVEITKLTPKEIERLK